MQRRVRRYGLGHMDPVPLSPELNGGYLVDVSGCGGSGNEVKTAQVKAGEMPANGEWTGVYYNPVYGYLHLVKDGVPAVHEPKAEGLWITAERLQQHELVIAG